MPFRKYTPLGKGEISISSFLSLMFSLEYTFSPSELISSIAIILSVYPTNSIEIFPSVGLG